MLVLQLHTEDDHSRTETRVDFPQLTKLKEDNVTDTNASSINA